MKKIILVFLGTIMFVSNMKLSSVAENINISRLYGADRYETAVSTNRKYMKYANGNLAVISGGNDFKTALYGSYMASALNVPYFVNPKHGVRSDILKELNRLNVKQVYIVGDYNILDNSVDNTFKSKGFKIKRIYDKVDYVNYVDKDYGDYYNISINEQVDNILYSTFFPDRNTRSFIPCAIIINDKKYPDLLSSSPLTSKLAREGTFIANLYDVYSKEYDEFTEPTYGWHYLTIGGYNSVTENLVTGEWINDETLIENDSRRIYGSNRYQTAIEVAKSYKKYLGKNIDTIVLVNGEDYPDALSSSLVATQNNGAILLTQSKKLNTDTKEYIKESRIKNIIIVGGEKSVSKNVEKELRELGN